MSDPFLGRLVPTPAGYDNDVKRAAARAERAWEVVTGTLTFAGASGGAAVAAGALALPIAPFVAAIVAGSFYFKLRAKWAKEDPRWSDFHTATPFEPPRFELMAVLPWGPVPRGPGAAALPLLFSAGRERTCHDRLARARAGGRARGRVRSRGGSRPLRPARGSGSTRPALGGADRVAA